MTLPGGRRVLLDTSVVIEPPRSGLASIADFVAVTLITATKLEYGVGAAADSVERQRCRRREQLVVDTFDVIPFDIARRSPAACWRTWSGLSVMIPGCSGSTC